MDDDLNLESFKVVLLGESGVGKTSIISLFTDKEYQENQISTTGAKFSAKTVYYEQIDKEVKFEIWDTAGQEKYRALTKMFYKDASVAILVYDITRVESFEEIEKYWAKQIKENAPADILIAVAANKSDLYEKEMVEEGTGRKFAESLGAIFKLTSAKNQDGIENLFQAIVLKHYKCEMEMSDKEKEEREEFKKELKRGSVKISKKDQDKHKEKEGDKKCC